MDGRDWMELVLGDEESGWRVWMSRWVGKIWMKNLDEWTGWRIWMTDLDEDFGWIIRMLNLGEWIWMIEVGEELGWMQCIKNVDEWTRQMERTDKMEEIRRNLDQTLGWMLWMKQKLMHKLDGFLMCQLDDVKCLANWITYKSWNKCQCQCNG